MFDTAESSMKNVKLWNDSEIRPLRFALVVAAIVVSICLTQKSNAQTADSRNLSWTTSFDDAIAQAKEQDAPIMLYFGGSDWCPWSQKLSAEVFNSPEFSNWMDQKLVPVFVDFPKTKALPEPLARQNNTLLSRYRPHLTGFPTALFVKPDGTVVGKLGYVAGGVRAWTHKAQAIVAKLDKVAVALDRKLR